MVVYNIFPADLHNCAITHYSLCITLSMIYQSILQTSWDLTSVWNNIRLCLSHTYTVYAWTCMSLSVDCCIADMTYWIERHPVDLTECVKHEWRAVFNVKNGHLLLPKIPLLLKAIKWDKCYTVNQSESLGIQWKYK